GVVKSISADDRWIVIYDRNSDISRLVEVLTGKVLAIALGDNSIQFSPNGIYATIYRRDTRSDQLFELASKKLIIEVSLDVSRFSPNKTLIMTDMHNPLTDDYTTRVIDIKTGTTRLEVTGMGDGFSPDSRLIAVTDTKRMTARIIEIDTANLLFEFSLQNFS